MLENAETAGRLLAAVFGDHMTAYDVGGRFTCGEAESIAEAMRLLGQGEAAAWWLYLHGQHDDDEDDIHADLASPDGVNPFTGESES